MLQNCFFRVDNKIFKQVIDIPVGSDPAPLFANLFLYYYESKMDKEKNTDIRRVGRFLNTFRFIDDLTVLNDGDEFKRQFKEMYPSE